MPVVTKGNELLGHGLMDPISETVLAVVNGSSGVSHFG